MSMAALRWVRPIRCTPPQKAVLWALADQANDAGEAWPSVAGLVEATCLSERSVQGAILSLRKTGLLTVEIGGGRARTSCYRLALNTAQEVRGNTGNNPAVGAGNTHTETPQVVHETPQEVRNTPQEVRETPQELHPNPQEPSITLKEPNRARARLALDLTLPPWLSPEAWQEWTAYRRKRSSKGWTERAAELSIAELAKFRADGHDPAEVIRQSIASGWVGLFPLKASRQPPKREAASEWIWRELEGRADPATEARPVTATIIDLPKGTAA